MSGKYVLEANCTITNAEGKVISQTSQKYLELEYEDLAAVEKATFAAMTELIDQKQKEKAKK